MAPLTTVIWSASRIKWIIIFVLYLYLWLTANSHQKRCLNNKKAHLHFPKIDMIDICWTMYILRSKSNIQRVRLQIHIVAKNLFTNKTSEPLHSSFWRHLISRPIPLDTQTLVDSTYWRFNMFIRVCRIPKCCNNTTLVTFKKGSTVSSCLIPITFFYQLWVSADLYPRRKLGSP